MLQPTSPALLRSIASTLLTTAFTGPVALAQDWRFCPATNHYYAVLAPSSAAAAETTAACQGAHLVKIDDQAEAAWLSLTFATTARAWIGLNDRQIEGAYVWHDGSAPSFFSWATGFPIGGATRNAVSALQGASAWIDETGAQLLPAVIERDVPPFPASADSYGIGCADPVTGLVPRLQVGTLPVIGTNLRLLGNRMPPTTFAFALVGFTPLQPGLPVPAPLDIPGCLIHVDPAVTVTTLLVTSTQGTTSLPLFIPCAPPILGLSLHAQMLPVTQTPNGPKLLGSNGVRAVAGAATVEIAHTEPFANAASLDQERSAAVWNGGSCMFAAIGGDGRHGEFSLSLCTPRGTVGAFSVYELNTDLTTIPGTDTPSGQPFSVTDGRFWFSRMVVPANVRLQFVGNNAPQFTVCGLLQVDGEIELSGAGTTPFTVPNSGPAPGQPGGRGGVFGGRGGNGGERGVGQGPIIVGGVRLTDGQNGADARVLAGHAYAATTLGTGGAGSPLWPTNGLNSSLVFPGLTIFEYCSMTTTGGGGGGSTNAGGGGNVVNANTNPGISAPPTPASSAVQVFPLPAGARASQHFLIGGGGGGGGGSHPAFANSITRTWANGAGGGGGGGAVALRAGHRVGVANTAAIRAKGGDAWSATGIATTVQPAPAGGGAGGSIVLVSARDVDLAGTLDVRGGARGLLDRSAGASFPPNGSGARIRVDGGQGGVGQLVLRAPGATTAMLPNALPAANPALVGPLQEADAVVACMSRWLLTNAPDAPVYQRYEIEAVVNGVAALFSDDPTRGLPARPFTAPIAVFFQGVQVDGNGQPIPGSTMPWREQVGAFGAGGSLAADARNAFRFRLELDTTTGFAVDVRRVTVFYRL